MKIGIIGANGMVGREVALSLAVMGVDVVSICRSQFSGVFLESCGLRCRYGSISNASEAQGLLGGCDVVADFSLPRGGMQAIREASSAIIQNCVRFSQPHAPFVYMSSLMALGIPPYGTELRRYTLAHTQYGAAKRHGERLAFKIARGKRESYVLRLGQVHGELQGVGSGFVRELHNAPLYLPNAGDCPSGTVFCFTIAEALKAIGEKREHPGRYVLVSSPPWSWREVYEYYARRAGIEADIRSSGPAERPRRSRILEAGRLIISGVERHAYRHREVILAYVLRRFPSVDARLKALHLIRSARSEIAASRSRVGARPPLLAGEPPGERLKSLTDSRITMDGPAKEVRKLASLHQD